MPAKTKASAQPMCDGCWGTPELRPSGTSFARHQAGDGSNCTGKPVAPVQGGNDDGKVTCPACGKKGAPLADGKRIRVHNTDDGERCEQKDTRTECNSCGRRIALIKGQLSVHQDLRAKIRCPGSAQAPDHKPVKPFAGARPTKATKETPPKRPPAPKGVDAAQAKASLFSQTIAPHGWKTAIEVDPEALTATAEATRGEEMITITWEEARCVGGTIFHSFRSRRIALRNKNAAVQRAAMKPEQIVVEYSRVSSRKVKSQVKAATGKRTLPKRDDETKAALRMLLPFDPKDADQATIAKAIVGKDITWHNRTSGKDETGTVNPNERAIRVAESKADGSRQVTFFLLNRGAKTIRLADLVSVG